jgi:hypothetical protein
VTVCCPDGIPPTLHLTETSACGCLNYGKTLTYNATDDQWESSTFAECPPGGPANQVFKMNCLGDGTWVIGQDSDGTCAAWTVFNVAADSCSPFHIVFQRQTTGACGCAAGQTVTVTITE